MLLRCVHHTTHIFVAESYVYHGEAVYYEGYTFVRVYLCKDPLRITAQITAHLCATSNFSDLVEDFRHSPPARSKKKE